MHPAHACFPFTILQDKQAENGTDGPFFVANSSRRIVSCTVHNSTALNQPRRKRMGDNRLHIRFPPYHIFARLELANMGGGHADKKYLGADPTVWIAFLHD